jgi:hypothetical protein
MSDTISLEEVDTQIEFQFATYDAIVNNEAEFEFYGRIVSTSAAIDAVVEIVDNRTYH